MRFALDHHYSTKIAEHLRDKGWDAVAAVEAGWEALGDDELLDACDEHGRVLVTNNVADFAVIAREWAAQGRVVPGLIFTSDATFPRAKSGIGALVRALDGLAQERRTDDVTDEIIRLSPPGR